MRVALITTTINVPTVLALYRKLGPDMRMFVAADRKTRAGAQDFCVDLGGCTYLSPAMQESFEYNCSEPIGWNCVERRNIALLEAVKWGAELIVTIDDDNIPIDTSYFSAFEMLFDPEWPDLHSLKASSPTGWVDPGCLLVPQTKHRGFPISIKSDTMLEPAIDTKIGVAQGLCLGNPDIDAVTRIATAPIIHSVSALGRAGIVVDPSCWTVFNTQNTAFIRELAPAMFQPPGLGRYSDIYASLICQRVMRERGLHVHFGQPLIWQQRNQHNLITDLRQEIDGMEHVHHLADILDNLVTTGEAIERQIYERLLRVAWWPKRASDAAFAFLDDMEGVL